MKPRYSVILGNLGNTCDRFLSSGYKEQLPKEEMIRLASEIPGIEGIELVGTWDITPANVKVMRKLLREHGLKTVSIIPDLFSQKRWGRGSFASKDKKIRQQALEESRIVSEIALEMKCGLVNLWLGQDGYDYPLQSHYQRERGWMVEGLQKLASEFPQLRFALEYKLKEPRTHSFQARAADTLLMAQEIGEKNVGVCIDVGHSLMASENVAEAALLLHHYGQRLFHMHFNDNYRFWDDDMIVGSIHFVEYLELLFWLKEVGYDGWYSMDQYPYREDGAAAVKESILFLQGMDSLLTAGNRATLRRLIAAGNATDTSAWVREQIFPTRQKSRKRSARKN